MTRAPTSHGARVTTRAPTRAAKTRIAGLRPAAKMDALQSLTWPTCQAHLLPLQSHQEMLGEGDH